VTPHRLVAGVPFWHGDSGMKLTRRRALTGISAAFTLPGPRAGAVVVPETTLRAEGLRPFISLAHQAQFAPLVALSEDGGKDWNIASSTWVGNFGGTGYLLTAGHVYNNGGTADGYLYRTRSGQIRHGTHLYRHPLFNENQDNRSGYDAAIVRLDRPVTDSGAPPLLFGHELEGGERIVFVGFGARGTGARGEHEELDTPSDNKTAAENTVDEVMDPVEPIPADDDAGNWIRVTMHRESEGGERLDGLLGGGDSGGSAWLRDDDGRWGIVGINVAGTGDTTYGTHSFFASVSGLTPWLSRVLPWLRIVA
jgi:hypothetical protein